ncbi:MAG: hypothetical protein CVU71_03690 [Deltaproteobacteria bacterium HGW-Deltaproteobacteria-6]|jgi:hypothetical protein|nr:MAG: hypothetical protein CVU71_03690 [Deltaproteobacteria bacterium HGW-Deltaproteobacteria-6]
MQLINNAIGGACAPPSIKFDDRLILAGLFAVALWVWGPNVFYGHAHMLIVFGVLALSIMAMDKAIFAFGAFLAAWFAYFYSAFSVGKIVFDETIIQAIDSLIFFMVGLVVYIVVKFGRTENKSYYNAICTISIILSIMGLIQYFYGHQMARATLGNQNFLAAFLAVSTILFFRKKWWMFLPLIIGVLFLTHTSTAIAAICVGVGFYVWGWIGAAVSINFGMVYFMLFKTPDSLIARIEYWTDAFNKVSAHWYTFVFGVGPGVYWQPGNMLHSEYAYLLWNFGIIGLLIVVAYIVRTFLTIKDRMLLSVFVVILIDSIGNHLMHTAATAMPAIIIIALMDRENIGRVEQWL